MQPPALDPRRVGEPVLDHRARRLLPVAHHRRGGEDVLSTKLPTFTDANLALTSESRTL